ncbi:MAG TPA: methylmalonyl-CoA epimerase [Anaerolineae bacterium]|nr:methylmalonyl-CoA epimerase [Anaerolineae bacterium]
MLNKIDHIGIAVRNLDEALRFYRDALGLEVEIEEVPAQQVRVAMLPIGESRIELLESTSPDGPIGRFIEKRGEGIQHICIQVADIAAALEQLRAHGVRLIDREPRIGAGGHRVAFLHPASASGVLIELSEALPAE